MPHIFISYAKKDTRALAEALFHLLNETPGLTAWMDSSLQADSSWARQIQDEIDRADYLVVLLSPDVNRPVTPTQPLSFVLNEIDYAQQEHKSILPVMVMRTKVPVQLAGTQYIDLTTRQHDPAPIVERIRQRFGIVLPVAERAEVQRRIQAIDVQLHQTDFAWVNIPERAYSIAKYPVSNAQYSEFKSDGGYQNSEWWSKSGWDEKVKSHWKSPRFWHDPKWNAKQQPVVGISWFEAYAFSRWLSRKLNAEITLPLEVEWLYAAQGGDSRPYPWGNGWNTNRCNNSVDSESWGHTTPVTKYEGVGNSPFGVVDMLGNTWEWCLDWDAAQQPLKGGCWRSRTLSLETRTDRRPALSSNMWGFRLVKYNK